MSSSGGTGNNADELLQALPHVWKHMLNFIDSMSLKCAVELSIFDIINRQSSRSMTLSELVTALQINPAKSQTMYRLLRFLIHSQFLGSRKGESFNGGEDEIYFLTPASRLLLKDEPLRVSSFVLFDLSSTMLSTWQNWSTWFQDDSPTPFNTTHGNPLFSYLQQDDKLGNLFYEAMAANSALITNTMITKCGSMFEGLTSLVDVGGGTGTVARAIAETFSDIKCKVLDLPHVIANLQPTRNLQFVGGDMFEAIPSADAVLLKAILHNWNDEDCIKILKRCKEAITSKDKGGKLIIIDMIIKEARANEDDDTLKTQLFFDMMMMVLLNGSERTEKEWEKLFLAAGFSHYKIHPILGVRSIIEVYP